MPVLNRVRMASMIWVPLWGGSITIVIASLMVGHWITLPHPDEGERLSIVLCDDEPLVEGEIAAFHFLYGDCPCSRRVLKHLLNRKAIDAAHERIVLIGGDPKQEAASRELGYRLEVVTPEELKARYGVESAPLLILANRKGLITYAGGYTSRKQGLDFQDEEIIRLTLAGHLTEGLPLYGCAVSKGLKAIVDPFDLKTR